MMSFALFILVYFADIEKPQKLESTEKIIAVSGGGYFPVMIKMQNGWLGAVIRGGASHLGIKGRLDWIYSKDDGQTWSKPSVIVDSEYDDRNPALGQMQDGTIVMAYAEATTYNEKGEFDTSIGTYTMFYVTSSDNGVTWSEKKPLYHGPIKLGSPYGKIVLLPDGTALMPVYGDYNPQYTGALQIPEGTKNISGILRSKDNGNTWGDFSIISATDHNETALLVMPDGKIVAMMRTYSKSDVELSESIDGGYTWSQPKQITRPNEHPADLCLLENGDILLVYGNRNKPYGVGGMLSHDKGETWDSKNRFLVEWTSQNTDCGYPSVIQLDDGNIVVMYYSVGTEERPNEEMAIVARFKL